MAHNSIITGRGKHQASKRGYVHTHGKHRKSVSLHMTGHERVQRQRARKLRITYQEYVGKFCNQEA